jgi:glycosyltransferase involved in cell wall biosynthesis
MKIVIVTNPLPKTNLSPVVSLSKLIQILPSDCSITLLGAGYSETQFSRTNRPIEVPVLPSISGGKISRFLKSLKIQKTIGEMILNSKPDIVLFWIADKMVTPLKICRKHKIPSVFWILFSYPYMKSLPGFKNKIALCLLKDMAYKADRCAVEARGVAEDWPELWKKRKDVPAILPIFADQRYYSFQKPYLSRGYNVCVVSRLASEKNILNIIEGFRFFNEQQKNLWHLHLIGDGPQRNEVLEAAAKAGGSVTVHGWVSAEEINDLLNDSRVFISASKTEGLPSSLQEAMLCGVPAIVTPVGGMRSIVTDRQNGWVLKGFSSQDVADGLNSFAHETNQESFSRQSVATIKEGYSVEACRLKMSAFLKK